MSLVHHDTSLVVGLRHFRDPLDFVHNYAVFVDGRTQQEIRGFLFDQEVSVCCSLVKTQTCANSEDCLPGVGSCDVHVELVCKLHTMLILTILRVEKEIAV